MPAPYSIANSGLLSEGEKNRRGFLSTCGLNLGAAALWSLLADESSGETHLHRASQTTPTTTLAPNILPRAKNVIFMFMVGGPSQHDLFEPKPELNRRHGEPLPESFLKRASFAQIQEKRPRLMGTKWKFARYGECGAHISELLPHTAEIVDRLTILKTVRTDNTNHAFAELLMNTGWTRFGRPSIGSWVTYGLGSEARDLPGFLVLRSGMRPRTKSANYGSGFLPSQFQGVPLRSSGAPILNLETPSQFTKFSQRRTIEAVKQLNRSRFEQTGDLEIVARIEAYELAARMQSAAPKLFDLSGETRQTLAAYGIANPDESSFARNCLTARRLVERGVRFVQIFHGDWDHHTDIHTRLPQQCRLTDQPAAALVNDLHRRGLLDDTLVIWGGELGRTPVAQTAKNAAAGRDHNIDAFTMWLAGGGVKSGLTHGTTDELGYFATSNSVHVYDLQATLLHLLGVDHTKLTYRHAGRDFRLTDIHGSVVEKILA